MTNYITKKHKDIFGCTGVHYYKDEKCTILHRKDGPAIEWYNGTKHWMINGKKHRKNGPAIEYSNGSKEWYKNGKLHREDGPAVVFIDNEGTHEQFFLNGKEFSREDYWNKVKFGAFI